MFALEPEGNVLRWCRVGGPYRPGGLHAIGGRYGDLKLCASCQCEH